MPAGIISHRVALFFVLLGAVAVSAPACGGGSAGGAGPDGAGQGLVLANFLQAGQDNVPINRVLKFVFSEPVSAASIGAGSIQIREGASFGLTADGEFLVDGATVYFEPRLPSLCGAADAGLQPGTTYRVTVMGDPEEFSVKNSSGQPLDETITYEFATRPEADPEYLEDQIPATPPAVTSIAPGDSEAAVTVVGSNQIVIGFTENLDPCTISSESVRFHVYEVGDSGTNNVVPPGPVDDPNPNADNETGFTPWDDQLPDDPYSWGSSTGGALPDPQVIPASLELVQNFDSTELRIIPDFGVFPENSLCVVDLTFLIRDFGGSPLAPTTFSFTTQNLPMQEGVMRVEFDTDSEDWPQADRTADIDTGRSPNLAQGWLLFAGDGDNGNTTATPTFPIMSPGFLCESRPNDGFKDHFDPVGNVTLDTGSSRVPDTCANETDGSQAVVWEFATFRIRNGVTVTITGKNPAILLVQGVVLIESGGVLRARGGNGANGEQWGQSTGPGNGGTTAAGGGPGGKGATVTQTYGRDGFDGYGSPDYNTAAEEGGHGSGEGAVSASSTNYSQGTGNSAGGGGGGHAMAGSDGGATPRSGNPFDNSDAKGLGGGTYPDGGDADKMYTPSAGSGGGGSGSNQYANYSGSYYYDAPGGGGGAGGGFIDITSQADIRIYGMIDVSGGRGGRGGVGGYWAAGGAGGGSGGGMRLLTPANIDITNGNLNAAGGQGGPGASANYTSSSPLNNGGAGGSGRIAMEDGDAIISGVTTATLTPPFGGDGFYVGPFNSSRFQGGGLDSEAVSGPILLGPLSAPTFIPQDEDDFLCAIPSNAAIPPNGTSILLEAAGYPINPDGTVDMTGGDNWYTIGYFSYSGSPNEPSWSEGSNPPDVPVANAGSGIGNLNGSAYMRLRIRFFLPGTMGATTPGPWLDHADFRFTYDQ